MKLYFDLIEQDEKLKEEIINPELMGPWNLVKKSQQMHKQKKKLEHKFISLKSTQ
jgi:hypothetical protein